MATGREVATRAGTQLDVQRQKMGTLRDLFGSMRGQFAAALPKHMTADRLIRIALTSVQKNPRLLECEPKSFVGALMMSAQLGLEPDDALGEAYLIPRKNGKLSKQLRRDVYEVCFQPGYKGLVKLAQNSGQIASISTNAVRLGDNLDYEHGLVDRLTHREGLDNWNAEITHVYAIVRTKDGGTYWDCWPAGKVDAHRARYSEDTRDDAAWKTNWEWMAKKTVLIQVLKLCPKSVEMARAISVDERVNAGMPMDVELVDMDAEAPAPRNARASLVDVAKAAIAGRAEKPSIEPGDDERIAAAAFDADPPITTPPAPDPVPGPAAALKEKSLDMVAAEAITSIDKTLFLGILKGHGADRGKLGFGLGTDGQAELKNALQLAIDQARAPKAFP